MGIFDIFKKKKEEPAQPLSLETLLQKAATEPAFRPALYKRLLSDDLVIMTDGRGPEGARTAAAGEKIRIFSYPDGKIPVFTSKERIFDKGVVKEEVHIMEIKGKDLFGIASGAGFILNPYSDYGKELLPGEVEDLLNGTIFTSSHKEITIEKETPVQIGQPAIYPSEVVKALSQLFSTKPHVKAAYLGWIYNPDSGDPPHYIFAIEGEGDLKSITNEAGFTANQILKPGEIVDFIHIDYQAGLSDYFLKQTKPFYKR